MFPNFKSLSWLSFPEEFIDQEDRFVHKYILVGNSNFIEN